MENTENDDHDDGIPWGCIRADGSFFPLPKRPLLLAGYRNPPFDVHLDGRDEIRHIVVDPASAGSQGAQDVGESTG